METIMTPHGWAHAESLVKEIKSNLKPTFGYADATFDFGSNGYLMISEDIAGVEGSLFKDGKNVYEFSCNTVEEFVTDMMIGGWLQPKCSSCNDTHVGYLKDQMERMTMSKNDPDNDGDDDSDNHKEPEGRSPLEKDENDESHDGVDEDFLDDVSSEDFGEMSKEDQDLVIKLMEKHKSPQNPQICAYPDGGNEVRIFGADGLYYYYVITPASEIVHLATMAKSNKEANMTAFKNYKFTQTCDELYKSNKNNQKFKIVSVEENKKDIPLNKAFYKEVGIVDLLEKSKKELLVCQMNSIGNRSSQKVVL